MINQHIRALISIVKILWILGPLDAYFSHNNDIFKATKGEKTPQENLEPKVICKVGAVIELKMNLQWVPKLANGKLYKMKYDSTLSQVKESKCDKMSSEDPRNRDARVN